MTKSRFANLRILNQQRLNTVINNNNIDCRIHFLDDTVLLGQLSFVCNSGKIKLNLLKQKVI